MRYLYIQVIFLVSFVAQEITDPHVSPTGRQVKTSGENKGSSQGAEWQKASERKTKKHGM